jgi:hypothetical protein
MLLWFTGYEVSVYSPADWTKQFLKRCVVQQCVEKMERALTNVSKRNLGETTVKNLCFKMFFIAF